ncbi:hypothetical protein HMPREF9723_02355 [Treponema denticola OTK]|uniref:Uncharacterized protein n=1 Tax=Treponema denticola OTK TaxID=999434 RepID=A0A0F6ML23_TREDN|nr:hypothetical protein [Treponema denticola]EMB19658.1 hypothetical protein HMPREF9723_02355 [Treponema denticola OTK]
MKKTFLQLSFLFLSFFVLFASSFTDEKQEIKNTIKSTKYNVQTIAITRTAIVCVYGGNGFHYSGIPKSLADELKECNNKQINIADIHISESGEWVIVGDMVINSPNIPLKCENAIRYLIDDKDLITCVSFNDYGDWVVLGIDHFYASPKIEEFMKYARDKHGHIKYVNITNDAVIVSCENGQFCSVGWDVPLLKNLSYELDTIDFNPKIIKLFPQGDYFIGNDDINRWSAYF